MLWQKKITQVGDFFNCEKLPPVLLSMDGLKEKYGIKIDFLSFHRIKTCIKLAAKNLNHKIYNENLSDIHCPRLPLLFKLSCLASKGCSIFYQTLRAREVARRSTVESEDKWHSELGTVFSINFWDKIWKINKGSLLNNKMKWVTLQINRFLLPTNYTVHKYKKNQNPGCSFCTTDLEKLPHLLWECPEVRGFWTMIQNILSFYFPQFVLGRKEAIFGDVKTESSSITNTMIGLAKQFIWACKFTTKILDEVHYINFMKKELKLLWDTMQYKNKLGKFAKEWGSIFEHFEV